MTGRGVCRVILGDDSAALVAQLRGELHAATLVADDPAVARCGRGGRRGGERRGARRSAARALPLDLRGTAFQQRVWKELTRVPRGETMTYGELARRIGAPGATRAVGTACGANPVAVVVPCHRVLRGDGALGGLPVGRGAEGEAARGGAGGDIAGGMRGSPHRRRPTTLTDDWSGMHRGPTIAAQKHPCVRW